MTITDPCAGRTRSPASLALAPRAADLRAFLHEMVAMGLFDVSSGGRCVEQMLDRLERSA